MQFISSETAKARMIVAGVLVAVMAAGWARADIINVPGDYDTIQEAIEAAHHDGDEIVVAPGTYNEAIDFLGKVVWLRSSDGQHATTIDGNGAWHVVQCVNDEGPDTILEGFTITGGDADGGGNDDYGGGMLNIDSSPTVMNCTFTGNSADCGGGMCTVYKTPLVMNCTFISNVAESKGGGMFNFDSSPTVMNCTFTGNMATEGGGMQNVLFSTPKVANCIFWGDTPDGIDNEFSAPVVTYCDVQGEHEGNGNIDADPLFVDPVHGDYHLSAGSPCIDAGVNNALPADALDLDEDGDVAERVPLDLDGNPRFADDPDTADSGCGSPVIVDMGAYEYPGEAWHPLRIGDIDGNGAVNTADLLALLGAWGGYEDDCVLADLDYSGAVDTSDLLTLLGNWG